MEAPQLDFNLVANILEIIQPPTDLFPPTNQFFLNQLNEKFIHEAQKFLSAQKGLYLCCKNVQKRLKVIVQSSTNLSKSFQKKDQNLKKIYDELIKYHQNKQMLENREKTLSMICQLIKLQNLKETLLIEKKKNSLFQIVSSQNQKELSHKTQNSIDQQIYLQNIMKIYEIIKESDSIFSQSDRQKYSLINQIMNQLTNLFQTATAKALNEFLNPLMVQLILKKFTKPFLDERFLTYNLFQSTLVSNRVRYYRIALNPIINNLNYANNVSDLYEVIIDNWLKIISQEIQLFSYSGQYNILKSATKLFIQQIMPKLEKNVYKIKNLSQICFVRFKIHFLYQKLLSVQQWTKRKQQIQKQDPSQAKISQKQIQTYQKQKWEPFPSILQKLKTFLSSKLQQQSQMLAAQKFNIYSIASYVPIRQHLQKIKLCKSYNLVEKQEQINWQIPFQKLFSTRQPQQQPNNKSLVIFNLNIWYLYLKIIKNGSYQTRAVEVMLWCKQRFVEMNIQQTIKSYYQSLQKILDMCGNMPAFKNVLYAQLNLLGHQNLRNQIALTIRERYLKIYEETLKKLQKKPMNNTQIKEFCQLHKINLNKFGKFSNQICIYSVQQLDKLLNYY